MNTASNTSDLINQRADLVDQMFRIRWNSRANHRGARLALKAFDAAHPEIKALARAVAS